MTEARDPLVGHRPWLLAAAAYNVAWGLTTVAAPMAFFDLAGIPHVVQPELWRAVGLLVLLYAPAYVIAARRPFRWAVLVGIALLGHLAGPVGYAAGRLNVLQFLTIRRYLSLVFLALVSLLLVLALWT